jgi:hypothetical protein
MADSLVELLVGRTVEKMVEWWAVLTAVKRVE